MKRAPVRRVRAGKPLARAVIAGLAALEVRGDGLAVRTALAATRLVRWEDVQRVELIGQTTDGATITRWRADRDTAFHVVIHTREGRISVHRWMIGVDALLDALSRAGVLDRADPTVPELFQPERPIARAITGATRVMSAIETASMTAGLAIGTFIAALVLVDGRIRIVDGLLIDALLVALLALGGFFAVLAGIRALRARRFGAERSELPLRPRDAVALYGEMIGAGPLLYFGTSLLAGEGATRLSVAVLVAGVLLASFAARDLRRLAREP
jgi:hypothetical protein